MNKRLFFVLIVFCLIIILVSLPYFSSDLYALPSNVVSFYSSAGNFYLDSFSGSFISLKNLMGASAMFYDPLPKSVVASIMQFGGVLIGGSYQSVNGLASIGSLVLGGVDKVLPY